MDEILQSVLDAIQSIDDRLKILTNKIDQLSINQSSESDDDMIDRSIMSKQKDDLIERFRRELEEYQIDFDLIYGKFNVEQVKNKASYYFKNKSKITNNRAYLIKLCRQIDIFEPCSETPNGYNYSEKEKEEEEGKRYLDLYNLLDEEQIEAIRFNDERIMWLLQGRDLNGLRIDEKIQVVKSAIKQGVIK